MTSDEIKDAIRGRVRVRFRGQIYFRVNGWQQVLKRRDVQPEEWITSLMLVETRRRLDGPGVYETIYLANVEECEAVPYGDTAPIAAHG